MILRENDKPADLTPEEWKWEKRIGNFIIIAVGVVLFVVMALLMAERVTP